MFLKRKIDDFLVNWKKQKDKKPLIILGQRQIGKTFSILNFARNYYEDYLYINFADHKNLEKLLINNQSSFVINTIENYFNKKLIPNKTIIIFDEIQHCTDIITSLKTFKINENFDIIVSGSNLGYFIKKITLLPIGYAEVIKMKSFDFEEFLWAFGVSDDYIEEILLKMNTLTKLSEKEYNFLREYYILYEKIGCLPEAICKYLTDQNFKNVYKILSDINKLYIEDINQYIDNTKDKFLAIKIYEQIPLMLARKNKKFKLSDIKLNFKFKDFYPILYYFKEANLINLCQQIKILKYPIKVFDKNNENLYKIYHKDQGILKLMLDSDAIENDKIVNYKFYKGAISENTICEMLAKQDLNYFYYKNKTSTAEIDFIIERNCLIFAVEVKAKNGNSKSLKFAMQNKENEIELGIKLIEGNIGYSQNVISFPLFLAPFLKQFIDNYSISKFNLKEKIKVN